MKRRRKGPTPSRLPEKVPVRELIDVDEVAALMEGSCWRKHKYESQHHARQDAARLSASQPRPVIAYRCPFHSLHDGKHWHVGHPPNSRHLERIALAIRWCTAHPDETPTPTRPSW